MTGPKHPLLSRGAFVPARYSELRTQAAAALRKACEGLEQANDRELVAALVHGRAILLEMDALWFGEKRAA